MNAANELFQNYFVAYERNNEHSESILEALIKLFDRVGSLFEKFKDDTEI